MPSQKEIREQVTGKIIEALEKDLLPWRRTWKVSRNAGRPVNVVSKKPYSGVNPLLLEIAGMQHGFESKFWGTFKQWQGLGCQVKKRPNDIEPGKWGTTIVFCKPINKTVEDPNTGEDKDASFFMLRTYTVFNAEQVSGAGRYQVHDEWDEQTDKPDFEPADDLIQATGAEIRHFGQRAFYAPPVPDGAFPNHKAGDYIQVPSRFLHESAGAYYETVFHELSHWSEVRLNWTGNYAQNELIAEISSCYLASELGVPQGEDLENHAAYVKNWLQAMRGDPSYIFKASSMASKTTDFLLSFVREPEVVSVG